MSQASWRVRLTLPADNRYLHIVRLTASGAAAEAGLDAAEVEDLKIAVDELCSVAIAGAETGCELDLDFSVGTDGLVVEATVPAQQEPTLDELAQAILDATVDSVGFDHASYGGGFKATKMHRGQ